MVIIATKILRLFCEKYQNFVLVGVCSEDNETRVNYRVEVKKLIRSRLKIFGENSVTEQNRLE
jgi:hypothetical protein